jgi:hypothetical protein
MGCHHEGDVDLSLGDGGSHSCFSELNHSCLSSNIRVVLSQLLTVPTLSSDAAASKHPLFKK